MPFTAIPLSPTKQEAMGTEIKMRQWQEVGIIRTPIFLAHRREDDVDSSHGAGRCAHSLHRITDPIRLPAPATAGQSFPANHALRPLCPQISASLAFRCGRKKDGGRKPLAFKCLHRTPEWSGAVR